MRFVYLGDEKTTKSLLVFDLIMTGGMSMDQAKTIRRKRELAKELVRYVLNLEFGCVPFFRIR